MTRMLGRLPRIFKPQVPHMSALSAKRLVLPPIPNSVDYMSNLNQNFGTMLNDQIGDCTCAAVYHGKQVWSFNASGQEITEPDNIVGDLYKLACGWNGTDEGNGTDQGGVEQDVLTYLLNIGMPLTGSSPQKILAFLEVDSRNHDDITRGIYESGLVYIGFNVPAYLMDGDPSNIWDVNQNGDNTIIGGHAVVLPAYDKSATSVNYGLISWGARYEMTKNFFDEFVDEVYTIADPDWINSTGKTPLGLSIAELEQQMQYLKAA